MAIFKFWLSTDKKVTLDKLIIEDITTDSRSKFIPVDGLISDKYKVADGYFMVVNDMFYKLGKMLSTKKYDCLQLVTPIGDTIFILPSRGYVFWNGKSIEPSKHSFVKTKNMKKILYNLITR